MGLQWKEVKRKFFEIRRKLIKIVVTSSFADFSTGSPPPQQFPLEKAHYIFLGFLWAWEVSKGMQNVMLMMMAMAMGKEKDDVEGGEGN